MCVLCKDVIGFGGQLYGQFIVYFEIFVSEVDFCVVDIGFWCDCIVIVVGIYGLIDVYGDSYFIIFVLCIFSVCYLCVMVLYCLMFFVFCNIYYDLDVGQEGQNVICLLVKVVFGGGNCVFIMYVLDDQGEVVVQVGQFVQQVGYEYEMYCIVNFLYDDCISVGFDYLCFGCLLGVDIIIYVENWQLVCYVDVSVGYINLVDFV